MKTNQHKALALISIIVLTFNCYAQSWDTVSSRVNKCINAFTVFNDTLYMGGNFTEVGDMKANYLVKYNNGFYPTTNNLTSYVLTLNDIDSSVFMGGDFWQGSWQGSNCPSTALSQLTNDSLTNLNGGMLYSDAWVNSVVKGNNAIYVGGNFTTMGAIKTTNVVEWANNTWVALGKGLNNTVNAMTFYNGDLYVGGTFTTSDSITTLSYIAMWNGQKWVSVGGGMNAPVSSLIVYNGMLYAGGYFSTAGDVSAYRIAAWNGTNWIQAGHGLGLGGSHVNTMAVYHDELYVGGAFDSAGTISANNIARWNGGVWSQAGTGTNGAVNALCVYKNNLYVGGEFLKVNGMVAPYAAAWNTPSITTSVETVSNTTVESVYPNPSNGVFNIKLAAIKESSSIEVYSMSGEKIYSKELSQAVDNTCMLNIENEPNGIYVYRVTSENGEVAGTGKLEIRH